MRTKHLTLSLIAVAGLAGCGEETSDHPSQVTGLLIDPEKYLYARLGLLGRALGTGQTGDCYDVGCTGADAIANPDVLLGSTMIRALEDDSVGTDAAQDGGQFDMTVPHGEYHFIVDNSEGTYLPTIDGLGTLCESDEVSAVLHGCGGYGMMALVAGFTAAGVASVVIMDDTPMPEFLPVPYLDAMAGLGNNIAVAVDGGEAKYWVFNPTDPVEMDDPAWGWQPLVDSPDDVPEGMVWIGMVSIINPTGDMVGVEITDAMGRYTYDPLDLPVAADHYTFAEAMPTK